MSIWEPYTERARRTIILAQEEAQMFGSNKIDTHHLLLGIISERESIASGILESHGLYLHKAREEVQEITSSIRDRNISFQTSEMTFTDRMKEVCRMAFDVEKERGLNYIGTEILLLALLREKHSISSIILQKYNVTADSVDQAMKV